MVRTMLDDIDDEADVTLDYLFAELDAKRKEIRKLEIKMFKMVLVFFIILIPNVLLVFLWVTSLINIEDGLAVNFPLMVLGTGLDLLYSFLMWRVFEKLSVND